MKISSALGSEIKHTTFSVKFELCNNLTLRLSGEINYFGYNILGGGEG